MPKGLARPRLVGIPGFGIDNRLFFLCLICLFGVIFTWQALIAFVVVYTIGRALAAYDEYLLDDVFTQIAWRLRTGWTGMLVDESTVAKPSKFATQQPPLVI